MWQKRLAFATSHVSWLRILIILSFCLWNAPGPTSAEPSENRQGKPNRLRIAIHCSEKVLQVWRGTELISEYPVETGKNGFPKKRGGDHRTPIGDYQVSWMASRKSDTGHKIVDGKSWCTGNKFVYANSGSSLEKLWSDAYGGSEATVISINYPNDKESRKGYSGDCIHIHAVKRPRDGVLPKSYGCIHMFAADAKELYEMVAVGTPVKILP